MSYQDYTESESDKEEQEKRQQAPSKGGLLSPPLSNEDGSAAVEASSARVDVDEADEALVESMRGLYKLWVAQRPAPSLRAAEEEGEGERSRLDFLALASRAIA